MHRFIETLLASQLTCAETSNRCCLHRRRIFFYHLSENMLISYGFCNCDDLEKLCTSSEVDLPCGTCTCFVLQGQGSLL